jgi:hypothetical protein
MIIVWLKEFKCNTMLYVHTQNGLAKSLIKIIKLIAQPLLHNYNLPTTCWAHAVLHTADLIQLRPTTYNSTSPLYLVCGNPPSIFLSAEIWLCYLCTDFTSSTYIYGPSHENGDQCKISFPIHYKILGASKWGFIHYLVH